MVFFEAFPTPNFNFDIGSKSHGEQTGAIMAGVDMILVDKKPDVVLVGYYYGLRHDVCGFKILCDVKDSVDIGSVEIKLRRFDRTMSEEVIRIVADHQSRYLFAPT